MSGAELGGVSLCTAGFLADGAIRLSFRYDSYNLHMDGRSHGQRMDQALSAMSLTFIRNRNTSKPTGLTGSALACLQSTISLDKAL